MSSVNVNPAILKWARETAGWTRENAVEKLAIKDARGVRALDRLAALEVGEEKPTQPLLVKMAKQYQRPLLVFYLPDIPPKANLGKDFRMLPERGGDAQAGLVDAVLRDIYTRQDLVRTTLEDADEAEKLSFIATMSPKHGVDAVVRSIEQTLDFQRQKFRSEKNTKKSFAYLRSLVEARDIFVLLVSNLSIRHPMINVEAFRGFALADDVAPFVVINADDSPAAWSFTLVHELAHLWIGATGVSAGMLEQTIEKFCNDVASEFLLPMEEIKTLGVTKTTPFLEAKEKIAEFATARNVSGTMVAYKLCRAHVFSFQEFQKFQNAYRVDFDAYKKAIKERNKKKKGGPSYYAVRRNHVGTPLIQFVDRMMHGGNLSPTKAGMVLGVRAKNVYRLLSKQRCGVTPG